MSGLFGYISMVLLGLTAWGLIAPRSISRYLHSSVTRTQVSKRFGLPMAAFFIAASVTAPPQPAKPEVASSKPPTKIAQVTPAPAVKPEEPKAVLSSAAETQPVPFSSQTIQDATLAKGTSVTAIKGVDGLKTLTYEISSLNNKEVTRKLIKEEITTQPVTEVIRVGTKVAAAPAPASAPVAAEAPRAAASAPAPQPAAASVGGIVKKSISGNLCHTPGSTYYDRTKNYIPYNTLQECLNSGGGLPKR